MKIKRKFIPFILSGEKEYEYRINTEKCEGIYLIDNEYFRLVYFGYVLPEALEAFSKSTKNEIRAYCCKLNGWFNIQIDYASAEWIRNNLGIFLKDSKNGQKTSSLHLYKWDKAIIKKLELID